MSILPPRRMDDLTAAALAVVWLILLNKPFYPLYVWWFVGEGVAASCATLLAVPLYAGVLLLARYSALGARIALPLVGLADTLFAVKLFGAASGAELFFAPLALIAALSFHAGERRWGGAVLLLLYVVFIAMHGRYGSPLHVWSAEALVNLATLNTFSVASLMLYLGWRYMAARP